MINVLYQDMESVLKINGGLSAPFKVFRGIRQGYALSGMLYSLAIEPLLNKFRLKIEGFSLHRVKYPSYSIKYQLMLMIL